MVHMSIAVHELLHTNPHPKCPTHNATDSQESWGDVHNDAQSCAPGHRLPCQVHVTAQDKPFLSPQVGRSSPPNSLLDPLPPLPHSGPMSESADTQKSWTNTPSCEVRKVLLCRQETSVAMEAPRSHLVRPLQAVHYLGCLKSEEKDYGLQGQRIHGLSRPLILVFVIDVCFLSESLMLQFFAHFLLSLRNCDSPASQILKH